MKLKIFLIAALLTTSLSLPTNAYANENSFQNWLQTSVIQTQLQSLTQRVEALSLRLSASLGEAVESDTLTVVVEGATITKQEAYSYQDALRICHEHAYNTNYMWLMVECVYQDAVIYSDVFIAG